MDRDLLVFGAGSFARLTAKFLQERGHVVHAFLTSREPMEAAIDGIPVVSLSRMSDHLRRIKSIICGVFNRDHPYQSIQDVLADHGFGPIIWPWEFYPDLHEEFDWRYWLDPKPLRPEDWRQDHSYQTVLAALHDDESRVTMDRLIRFRSGSDLEFSSFRSMDEQYFNEMTLGHLPLNRPVSYLDLGAYRGDSLERLCSLQRVGDAVLVEPDRDNFGHLVAKLEHLCGDQSALRPLALPLAAGDTHSIVSLSGQGESVSSIPAAFSELPPSSSVTMIPMDHLMPAGLFDLIKVDVEGGDLAAINGMRSIIQRSNAAIAVSIYHRPRDLTDIPLVLMSILRDRPYSFYVRQHMFNSFDSVFYAVPAS